MHPIVAAYLTTVEKCTATVHEHPWPAGRPIDAFVPEPSVCKAACLADADTATLWEVRFDQQVISTVVIDLSRHEVLKRLGRFTEFGIEARETAWLEILKTTGIAPRLLCHKPGVLHMTYVGEPVRRHNLPADWRSQATRILGSLDAAGCRHNDIKCDNIMVLEGRLTLVDFGWATPADEPIPPEWPRGIGRQHRLDIHRFDDRHAIFAALESAERNEVDRSMLMAPDQPASIAP